MINNLIDKLLKRRLIDGLYPKGDEFKSRLHRIIENPTTVYTGIDATASSLHVGNLATIINSLYFQAHGHRVICVIGDATAAVGDPSGHSSDRSKLDKSVIEHNATSIENTLRRIFCNFNDFIYSKGLFNVTGGPQVMQEPLIVRNSDWYRDKNVVEFVSDTFRDVRVGWLLHKTSVQDRLATKNGMNAAEFCYQIFQAYDWLELWKRYDCKLQIGGSDQGGNIYTGHDLIKRQCNSSDSIGLLAPLITVNGKKLGKSTEKFRTAIWLNRDRTSPFELYQFFRKTPDDDTEKFLKVFSFYDDQTIESLIRDHLRSKENAWLCQRKLAEHACLLIHGEEGLKEAQSETEKRFNEPHRTSI